MEKWFVFSAYNSQSYFGFGTDEEAQTYADLLNTGKDVNLYHAEPLAAEDCEALDSGKDTDGFRLDIAIDTAHENIEWQEEEAKKWR